MSAHRPASGLPPSADTSPHADADRTDGSGEADATAAATRDSLLALDPNLTYDTAQALTRSPAKLRFPPRLEARFHAERADQVVRRYRFWGLVATVMYNLFVFADAVMLPDIVGEARWVRLGIVTPLLLLSSLLLPHEPWRRWREAVVSFMLTLVSASIVYLFTRSLHPNALQYHSGVILVLMFGAIVVRQRFGYAALTSAVVLAMYVVGVGGLVDMTMNVKFNSVGVMMGAIVISLMANYQMEADTRRSYLAALLQRIEASRLRRSRDEFDHLSKSDPLTGLDNRRSFDQRLHAEWSRALRNHESIAMLYIDIDHFKADNDLHGHQAGDVCLARVAAAIRDSVQRGSDLCARYGGEEFVVLLPQTTQEHALGVARRVRQAVEALGLPHRGSPTARVVTVSVGAASLAPTPHTPVSWLPERADRALYTAKDNGRNRVCGFQPPPA
ncbi:diguanylate cyclase domain-containing protein [Aquabacterium sp.]|uniref:GGDEF domain-containing protein n=1 Tax=Aquabacterium sp. TaxID=1872578 RepID=UPI0035AED8DE